MDKPSALQHNGRWRLAVWALRVAYVGLAIVIVSIFVPSLHSARWLLTIGMITWVAAAIVVWAAVLRSRHECPKPRPSIRSMQLMLMFDAVHVQSAGRKS